MTDFYREPQSNISPQLYFCGEDDCDSVKTEFFKESNNFIRESTNFYCEEIPREEFAVEGYRRIYGLWYEATDEDGITAIKQCEDILVKTDNPLKFSRDIGRYQIDGVIRFNTSDIDYGDSYKKSIDTIRVIYNNATIREFKVRSGANRQAPCFFKSHPQVFTAKIQA